MRYADWKAAVNVGSSSAYHMARSELGYYEALMLWHLAAACTGAGRAVKVSEIGGDNECFPGVANLRELALPSGCYMAFESPAIAGYMRKLSNRGLAEKTDDGWLITTKGVEELKQVNEWIERYDAPQKDENIDTDWEAT